MATLSLLADELLLMVVRRSSVRDVAALAACSRRLAALVVDAHLWTALLERDWRVRDAGESDGARRMYRRIADVAHRRWSGWAQWMSQVAPPQSATATLRFAPGGDLSGSGCTINRGALPWRISDGAFCDLEVSWHKHIDGHVVQYRGRLDLDALTLSGTVEYTEEQPPHQRWSGVWRYELMAAAGDDDSAPAAPPPPPTCIASTTMATQRSSTTATTWFGAVLASLARGLMRRKL